MTEIDLLWITVTLALGLVAVLSAQIALLQRRVRKLEDQPEPEPDFALHAASAGAQTYRDLYSEMYRRALADPQFRSVFRNFPEPAAP